MFKVTDYVIFGLSMLVFASVGAYHGFKGLFWSKTKSNRDFLTGASDHRILTAANSLFVSFISATTLIGLPSASYWAGMVYFVSLLSFLFAISFANFVVVPVYIKNELKTTLEFIKRRFNKTTFRLTLCLYVVYTIVSMGLWLSVPAKALVQLSTLSFQLAVLFTGSIVIFYTAFGGMRALVTVDLIQILIIALSVISVIVKGTVRVGGIDTVFEQNASHERAYFDLDPNPFTQKATTWTVLIGNTVFWTMIYSTSQAVLNRYQPSSDLQKAQKILWLQVPLMCIMTFSCIYFGLVIYASYKTCDPYLVERVESPEGFVPLYVSDIAGHVPGFVGIFMTGVFSSSLSSVASSINALATVANEHLIKKVIHKTFTGKRNRLFLRTLSIFVGLLVLPITFFASYLDNSLKARILWSNAMACPVFGLHLVGLLNPRCEAKGAIAGLFSGTCMGIYLLFAHYWSISPTGAKGVSVSSCPEYYCEKVGNKLNDTFCLQKNYEAVNPFRPQPTASSFDDSQWPFTLSSQLGGLATVLTTVIVASLTSLCFKMTDDDKKKNNKYLAVFLQKPSEEEANNDL